MKKLRIWKLGNLEHKLMPTRESMNNLAKLIKNIDGKNDIDLIWGPDLEILEYNLDESDVNKVLVCEPSSESIV